MIKVLVLKGWEKAASIVQVGQFKSRRNEHILPFSERIWGSIEGSQEFCSRPSATISVVNRLWRREGLCWELGLEATSSWCSLRSGLVSLTIQINMVCFISISCSLHCSQLGPVSWSVFLAKTRGGVLEKARGSLFFLPWIPMLPGRRRGEKGQIPSSSSQSNRSNQWTHEKERRIIVLNQTVRVGCYSNCTEHSEQ